MQLLLRRVFNPTTKINIESFKKWHIALTIVYVIQGVVIFVFSATHDAPLSVSFTTTDSLQSQLAGTTITAQGSQVVASMNVSYLVVAFLLVPAITHLLAATIWRNQYERQIKQGIHTIWWIEYGLTFSFIAIAVSLLSGIYDIGTLFLIILSIILSGYIGFTAEKHRATLQRHWPMVRSLGILTILTSLAPWAVVAFYLWSMVVYGKGKPAFMYVVVLTVLLLLIGIGLNRYSEYKGKWKNHLYAERSYLLGNVIIRSLLAWEIVNGLLRK